MNEVLVDKKVVHTVKSGSIAIDIVETYHPNLDRYFYDYRTSRKYIRPDGEEGRSAYCSRKDVRDNVRALMDVVDWLLENRG